jgi:UDP-glucuronate 4-epimerase
MPHRHVWKVERKALSTIDFDSADGGHGYIMTEKTHLITGAAGFIGYHLAKRILENGANVIGFDNLNDYYDVSLKEVRLSLLNEYKNFTFIKGDLAAKEAVYDVFGKNRPDIVINLAAQAGVRYSIENPDAYIESNINGFFNILEACRHYPVKHLIFASSSSVYGLNEKVPFSTADNVDHPISLYAATKKSNELMAYTYSHLYQIPATGLRFFTVYGPLGRPDMAYFKFAERIMRDEPIQVYNNGDLYRDFTYIDDIVEGMEKIIGSPPPAKDRLGAAYKIYNVGNNKPEKLSYFIEVLERLLGKEAKKEFLPMQPGDVYQTYADIDDLMQDFDFRPQTSLEDGLNRFIKWYREYYVK